MTEEGNSSSTNESRLSGIQAEDPKDGAERTLSPPADHPFKRNRRESKAVHSTGSIGGFIADNIRTVSSMFIRRILCRHFISFLTGIFFVFYITSSTFSRSHDRFFAKTLFKLID